MHHHAGGTSQQSCCEFFIPSIASHKIEKKKGGEKENKIKNTEREMAELDHNVRIDQLILFQFKRLERGEV